MDKTSISDIIARIEKEKLTGDIVTACREAGVTDVVFYTMKKREFLEDLTIKEGEVLRNILSIINGRKKLLDEMKGLAKC